MKLCYLIIAYWKYLRAGVSIDTIIIFFNYRWKYHDNYVLMVSLINLSSARSEKLVPYFFPV